MRQPNRQVEYECVDCHEKVCFKRKTLTPRCKGCRRRYVNARYRDRYPAYRARSKKQARAWRLRTYYGITEAEYQTLYKSQSGLCAVCRLPCQELAGKLVVDHDHDTGKVRGLLCHACNRALGLLKDSIPRLQEMIRYLEGV